MGLFTRKAKRAAKNVAKNTLFPKSKDQKANAKAEEPQTVDRQEYELLKAKYDAKMTEEWKEYYKTSCDGECETCEYYDWCPDDFDPSMIEGAEADAEEAQTAEPEVEEEPEVELTEEELAAKQAAEAYYADGCDGECETCEHYDWCPAEEEEDPDNKVLFKNMTEGDMKQMAKGGVELAREGAAAAKELKDAMDDIMSVFK